MNDREAAIEAAAKIIARKFADAPTPGEIAAELWEAGLLGRPEPVSSVCDVCHSAIWLQNSPAGNWWVHMNHPDDGHDATPWPVVVSEQNAVD